MRERETLQKTIKNETKIHHEINENSMQNPCSEKLCKKHRKSLKVEPEREPKSMTNPSKNELKNQSKKRSFRSAGELSIPLPPPRPLEHKSVTEGQKGGTPRGTLTAVYPGGVGGYIYIYIYIYIIPPN